MDISFEHKNDVLLAVVKGSLGLEAANRCADQMLAAAIDFRAEKVLLDCRNLHGTFTTTDRFLHTDHLSQIILAAQTDNRIETIHIAYIANPTILDPHRFGETVARNRGIDIFVTTNPPDAIEWLGAKAELPL